MFESKLPSDNKKAWNLVKELSGKKSNSQNFIAWEDRLNIWKNHFQKLLNNTHDTIQNAETVKVIDELKDIRKGDFDIDELKNGKTEKLQDQTASLSNSGKSKIFSKSCYNFVILHIMEIDQTNVESRN